MNFYDLLEMRPDTFDAVLLLSGLALALWALGLVAQLDLWIVGKVPSPKKTWSRVLLTIAALGLVAGAFSRASLVWVEAISQEVVWEQDGLHMARQVVYDGDEIYVRTQNGQVHRVADKKSTRVDYDVSGTSRIEAAGGVLYVLKSDGNVWSIILQKGLEQLHFNKIDSGTGTTQIEVAGETVYVLKDDGELWRRLPGLEWEQVPEDLPQLGAIKSSGNILYFLSAEGCVGAYFPQSEAHKAPELDEGVETPPAWEWPECRSAKRRAVDRRRTIAQRANEGLAQCGRGTKIAVDGRTTYLIDHRGGVKKCRDGEVTEIFHPEMANLAQEIDVAGGTIFVSTSLGEIWRIRDGKYRRYKAPSSEDGIELESITASPYGCFAVAVDGKVWRFSEHLRTRG